MDTILLAVGAIVVAVIVYLAFKPKKKQDKDTGPVPPIDTTRPPNIPDQVFGTKIPKIPTQENRTPGE